MDLSYLEDVGLTKGEKTVYLTLLETGNTTAGPIIKKSQLQRSAVYFCLETLIEKGLATFFVKNNVKHFEAASPKRFLDYIEKKEAKLKLQKANLNELIPMLESKIKPSEKRSMVKLFEGWNGVQSAFDEMINEKVNEDYLIYNVFIDRVIFERAKRFVAKFHKDRIANGISAKLIIGEEFKDTIGKDREKQKLTQVKYFPMGLSTPTAINVYNNKVFLAIWTKEPSAVLIENKDVAKSFREYFKIMWKTANK